MSLIDDEGTEGSCFVWTIQNFSYCLHKPGEYLDSPSFVLDTSDTDRWRLRIYPRGSNETVSEDLKNIGFRLYHENTSNSLRTAEFALSIRTIRGSFKKLGDSKYTFPSCVARGYSVFLKREELRRKGADTFLDNDTMVLKCRILKVDDNLLPPGQCYMRTIINVERTTNVWSLEKFRQNTTSGELTTKLPISLQMQSLIAVKLLPCRETFVGESIKLELKQIDKGKPCFFTCDFSLITAVGKIVHCVREEHRFDASDDLQVRTLPYNPPSKIYDYRDCELCIRCELAVSSGIEYSRVERVENSKLNNHQPARINLKEQDFADSWNDYLKRFYLNDMFTDATISTQNKFFPIHKAILCARSTVFHALFEQYMKENRTGVVDIEEIDADTVHKMLLFTYSDVVEDLNCNVASKLYSAADKYRITALKRICSDFLKKNLSVSNVCEVCVLASMHQDDDLKSFVQGFIVEHASEVMRSMEWKRFMQNHVNLHSETMHVLFLRNI